MVHGLAGKGFFELARFIFANSVICNKGARIDQKAKRVLFSYGSPPPTNLKCPSRLKHFFRETVY